jgi:hypothetical protein
MKKFFVTDTLNGLLDTFDTYEEAKSCYDRYVAEGIAIEREMKDVSGLSDDEIQEKVENFFSIEEEE